MYEDSYCEQNVENDVGNVSSDHIGTPVGECRTGKPKGQQSQRKFQGITNDEMKQREDVVQECVEARMSVKQIKEFIPTWGYRLSEEQIGRYLKKVEKPRAYKAKWSDMRIHDRMAIDDFIVIAKDANKAGAFSSRDFEKRMSCGQSLGKIDIRPDFAWWFGDWRFYLEEQRTRLTEAGWKRKLRPYVRLYEASRPFRVLWIVEGNINLAKRAATQVLKETKHEDLNIFLFISRRELEAAERACFDPIWHTAKWDKMPLLY